MSERAPINRVGLVAASTFTTACGTYFIVALLLWHGVKLAMMAAAACFMAWINGLLWRDALYQEEHPPQDVRLDADKAHKLADLLDAAGTFGGKPEH